MLAPYRAEGHDPAVHEPESYIRNFRHPLSFIDPLANHASSEVREPPTHDCYGNLLYDIDVTAADGRKLRYTFHFNSNPSSEAGAALPAERQAQRRAAGEPTLPSCFLTSITGVDPSPTNPNDTS